MKFPCSPHPRVGVEVAEDAGKASLELDGTVLEAGTETVVLRNCEAELEKRVELVEDVEMLEAPAVCDVVADRVIEGKVKLLDSRACVELLVANDEDCDVPLEDADDVKVSLALLELPVAERRADVKV